MSILIEPARIQPLSHQFGCALEAGVHSECDIAYGNSSVTSRPQIRISQIANVWSLAAALIARSCRFALVRHHAAAALGYAFDRLCLAASLRWLDASGSSSSAVRNSFRNFVKFSSDILASSSGSA